MQWRKVRGELFKVEVTVFFPPRISEKTKMSAWFGTAPAGQKGQTRGPASAREADVRQDAKDTVSCFFTDL